MKKVCPVCQREFETKNSKQKRCSKACEGKDRRGTRNNLWLGGKVTASCVICGAPISYWPSEPRQTCSDACLEQLRHAPKPRRARQTQRTCDWCGVSFNAAQSSKQRFCSRHCYWTYLTTIRGKDHHNYKGHGDRPDLSTAQWQRARDAVKRRANGVCEQCGASQRLVVHHVIDPRQRPDLAYNLGNLRAVCPDCHNGVHHPVWARWRKQRPVTKD